MKVQHAVVFRDYVQVAAAARYADELGDHAIGMRNRMDDVAADGQIEAPICDVEVVDALMLEAEPRHQLAVA